MKYIIIAIIAITHFSISTAQQAATPSQHYAQYLTTADFKQKVFDYVANPQSAVYLGDKPCLIDFYATWCGPCRAISPTIEKLAKEYNGKINVYKVDVDKEKELAQLFSVRSIPLLLFIPMNGQIQGIQGALPEASLREAIEKVLLP